MEATKKRQPVVLYEVPLLPELEIKSLIIKALPQAQLALQNIILRKKEGKYQAFLMVPADKDDQILKLKTVLINKESVTIKKPFTEAQIFVGRIPESLSIDQIREVVQAQYGKIVKINEGQPFEETKTKLKHCYIQFASSEDAEKFLFTPRKLIIQGNQLRTSRAYTMTESDETDKKLFLKIVSQAEDQDDLEKVINEEFRKQGQLREKIRVENGKATIIYTSGAVADKVLHNFKSGKIGKYEVILRPFQNRDSYTVFLGGLKLSVTTEDLEKAFSHYQNLISCNILIGSNTSVHNGTATFGSKDTFNQLLVEYQDDPKIKHIFANKPHVTMHMSAKDRNEYSQFRRGGVKTEKKVMSNMGNPLGGPMIPPMSQMSMYSASQVPFMHAPMQPMQAPIMQPSMQAPMNKMNQPPKTYYPPPMP